MRLCIVGPVTPFRSGIARHTTALARDLAGRADVDLHIVSFRRQYPGFLYPGNSDRDPELAPLSEIDPEFILDTINPLTWRSAVARIRRRSPDLVVVPAWTFFVAPCLGFITRSLRKHGVPVVTIVHNAADHEGSRWRTVISRFQLRQSSMFVAHNESIARDLRRIAPGIGIAVCPHPAYDEYPEPTGSLERKAALELLFFGLVRPYKGVDVALRALAAAGLPDVRLAVVGEFWSDRAEVEALVRDLGLAAKVELVPRYVSDREAAEYFARCDAVIAPYRTATGSGVVALAQRYGRPVIASDVPGLSDAIVDGSTGWLFPVGNVSALAELLRTHISRETCERMSMAVRAARGGLSWSRFADAVLDFARAHPQFDPGEGLSRP